MDGSQDDEETRRSGPKSSVLLAFPCHLFFERGLRVRPSRSRWRSPAKVAKGAVVFQMHAAHLDEMTRAEVRADTIHRTREQAGGVVRIEQPIERVIHMAALLARRSMVEE